MGTQSYLSPKMPYSVVIQKCVSPTARWTMAAARIIAWRRKASATVAAHKVTGCGTTTCNVNPKVSPQAGQGGGAQGVSRA